MEIGLTVEIKFCTRKMIKRTHFMFPCKMINLFRDLVTNVFQKNASYASQDLEKKVSRSSGVFMINMIQLKSKNNLFFSLQIITACQDISLTLFSK